MNIDINSIDELRKHALIRGMIALREDAARERDQLAANIRKQRYQHKRDMIATAILLALTAAACIFLFWSRHAQIN